MDLQKTKDADFIIEKAMIDVNGNELCENDNAFVKKVRISDMITEKAVAQWQPQDNILIAAPMGSGKSYFCKNTLYAFAKKANGKILMLIHRKNCVEQFQYEIKDDGKSDVIEVATYQSLEYFELNHRSKYNLTDYQFIVCDEFHYFFNDSSFNNKTAISFDLIMRNTESIHVFMSATGEHMTRYMEKYIAEHSLKEAIKYEVPFDFSFMKELIFFEKEETMEMLLDEFIEKGEKGIFFIQSAERAHELFLKYKQHCVFNCSANSNMPYKSVDERKIKRILIDQKFKEQFLITTACFDAGVNIIDLDVKHIVIDITDIGSLIQCIGRKRIQNQDDMVSVYIKSINNNRLAGIRRSTQESVEMADFFISSGFSTDALIEKYPRENDKNNILYDELQYDAAGNAIPGSYSKKLNEPMYFKRKEDIADYNKMLNEFGKFGYCKYLASIFGFYDEETDRYTYQLRNEDPGLERYLEKMTADKVVLLQKKDRGELIEQINARQNGKLLKGAKKLNEFLEAQGSKYRIKEFETSRRKKDEQTNETVKKKYKYAWKIVKSENLSTG